MGGKDDKREYTFFFTRSLIVCVHFELYIHFQKSSIFDEVLETRDTDEPH